MFIVQLKNTSEIFDGCARVRDHWPWLVLWDKMYTHTLNTKLSCWQRQQKGHFHACVSLDGIWLVCRLEIFSISVYLSKYANSTADVALVLRMFIRFIWFISLRERERGECDGHKIIRNKLYFKIISHLKHFRFQWLHAVADIK